MEPTNTTYTPQDGEISLKELIIRLRNLYKYLFSKWIIIFVAGIIGVAIGFAYAYFKKPVYTAQLSFALDDEQGEGLGGALGLASQFGLDVGGGGGGAFSGDNLLELIKSRFIVEKALLSQVKSESKDVTLADLYIEYNGLKERWASDAKLKLINFPVDSDRNFYTRLQDSVLGNFYKEITKSNLAVSKVDKKLSIISVQVSSGNEVFSKSLVEGIVKEVSAFYVETKTKKSVQNLEILQRQTDSVRRALNAAISGVATSADINPNPNPALQTLRVPSQKRQVDVQANQAILTELVKNLEISKISLRRETPLIQIIDSPRFPLEKKVVGKVSSGVVGGVFCGLLTCIVLVIRKLFKGIHV